MTTAHLTPAEIRELEREYKRERYITIALATAYLLSIVAAVWAIDLFGIVNILGTGLYAPAAVYVVGFTLVLRDFLHDHVTRTGMAAVIIVGAALSALVNPGLALASGVAFLIAEGLDALVYERVRDHAGRVKGIVLSNAISIPVDSFIFLALAFGSLEFFWGQVVGKTVATVVALIVIVLARAVQRAR